MAAFRSERIFGVTAEETLSFSPEAPYCLRQRESATMVGRLAEKHLSRFLKLFCSYPAGTPPGCKPILRRCPGYRCAQPPATLFQPSGLGRAASRGLRGSLYLAALSWLDAAN